LLAGKINASAGVVLVFGGQREAQLAGGQVLADPAFAKFLKDSNDKRDQLKYILEMDDVSFAFFKKRRSSQNSGACIPRRSGSLAKRAAIPIRIQRARRRQPEF
jgi:hypothetical protein